MLINFVFAVVIVGASQLGDRLAPEGTCVMNRFSLSLTCHCESQRIFACFDF